MRESVCVCVVCVVCVVCLRERWVGAVGLFSKYVFVLSVCAQISENGRQQCQQH